MKLNILNHRLLSEDLKNRLFISMITEYKASYINRRTDVLSTLITASCF